MKKISSFFEKTKGIGLEVITEKLTVIGDNQKENFTILTRDIKYGQASSVDLNLLDIKTLIKNLETFIFGYKFNIGDRVRKVNGYKWDSIVIGRMVTLKGEKRIVCECTASGVEGALHIFNEQQMENYDG